MSNESEERRSFRPWDSGHAPAKILVIRLRAIGDVVIALPACVALRQMFPSARIDMLTSEACLDIPRAVRLFDRLYSFTEKNGRWGHACQALMWGARIGMQGYDVIVDLQRHRASQLIRRVARPRAWGEFDRFSAHHALERVADTFQRTGFPSLTPVCKLEIRPEIHNRSMQILREQGWDGKAKLVVLNPAGLWVTRNWPLQRYVDLADLWTETEDVRFLLVGTGRIEDKARRLSDKLQGRAINLTNRTTLAEALGVIQHASVVISEDSGLLHMGWVSGKPTIALFGSTRSDWTRPLGAQSRFLGSEDLPCGACMQATCKFGDVHCLTRHASHAVLRLARDAEKA